MNARALKEEMQNMTDSDQLIQTVEEWLVYSTNEWDFQQYAGLT